MKKIFVMILAVTLLACSCRAAGAEEKPKESAVKKSRKDMTKEELVAHIKERLDRTHEILDFIPGLRKGNDPSGAVVYSYNGVRVEELDRDTAYKLLSRIQTEAVRINTERINKQLESIRQAEQVGRLAQQASCIPRAVQAPPEPPKVPPSPPQPQNQIPKTPQLPPEPPKR